MHRPDAANISERHEKYTEQNRSLVNFYSAAVEASANP
jgi:hypothetical protein